MAVSYSNFSAPAMEPVPPSPTPAGFYITAAQLKDIIAKASQQTLAANLAPHLEEIEAKIAAAVAERLPAAVNAEIAKRMPSIIAAVQSGLEKSEKFWNLSSAAVIGVGVFISANSLTMACCGRFLIGLGTAFAYIGVLKLASVWLAPNRFATVAGLTTAFGMFSAIFSDKYLTAFVQSVGYKNALHTALIVGVALSAVILIFMRSKPKNALAHTVKHDRMSFVDMLRALLLILKNPQMWLIGVIGCLFYLPASVFLDLWGIPYLKAVYSLTPEQAASTVSFAFVGWIIAGPTIGALSDRIKRRRLPLIISAVMATLLLSAVFYLPDLQLSTLYVLFFFIGVFCGAHPLCFALGKENSPNRISGTAVAVTNTLIMLGGMICQPLVGKLLDKHALNIVMQNGIPVYSASDYTYALTVVPFGLILAIFLSFFLKETYCQSRAREPEQQAVFTGRGKLALESE